MNALRPFLLNEDGPTAVEYAVLLALIITMCIGSLQFFGGVAGGSLADSANKINTASGS